MLKMLLHYLVKYVFSEFALSAVTAMGYHVRRLLLP